MFKYARFFLLFGMFFATMQGTDLCCPELKNQLAAVKNEIQHQLAAVKLDNEILTDLVKDLRAKLGSSYEWPPSKNAMCLPGFTYLPSAGKCYKVVYEGHGWHSASRKCQWLHTRSHLAAITSATESNALKTFLQSELSKNVDNTACIMPEAPLHGKVFWVSGQRLVENNCNTHFVWKPSSVEKLSLLFTSWKPGEPNCAGNKQESCMHIWPLANFQWNDESCNWRMCPLCEYKP